MRCSNCYKKIPENEEILQGARTIFRSRWDYGGGSEIVCVRCAKILKRRQRNFVIIFLIIWVTIFFGGIFLAIILKNK